MAYVLALLPFNVQARKLAFSSERTFSHFESSDGAREVDPELAAIFATAAPGTNGNARQIERQVEADTERAFDVNLGIKDLLHESLAAVDRQLAACRVISQRGHLFVIEEVAYDEAFEDELVALVQANRELVALRPRGWCTAASPRDAGGHCAATGLAWLLRRVRPTQRRTVLAADSLATGGTKMRPILGRYALSMGAAAALLAGCGESESPISASALAASGHAAPPVRLGSRSFHGYYLAKFTDVVGYSLPFSTLCLRFKSSGAWFSVTNAFTGTYLTSGNQLFASALAPWSPTAYASLQGSVNAKRGSGDYVITQPTGAIYSGGTFTMTRARGSGCK